MPENKNITLPTPTPKELESLKELSDGGHDQCWLAMKAAWDTLAEFCGGVGVPIDIEGMTINVPIDVISHAREHPDMTREERIDMVAHTEWCRGTAADMCEEIFGAEHGTSAHASCIENVAQKIATRIID
ncbi:MAG: hypothetical protein J7K40_06455 [candidate division Zixibacteria bacterium]|nr:hypothetical protein [candidate division Zixibacteria bacterium]